MSVFVNNLDDFIIPSQACVNPLVANKREEALKEEKKQNGSSSFKSGIAKISVQSDFSVSEYDVDVKPNLIKATGAGVSQKVATVSLNDCLACSGCVTSAESVLIQEQSYAKLLEVLKLTNKCVAVTLSPQSIASLAAFTDSSSVLDTFLRVATFLKSLGVRYVIDAAAGGDVVLLEAREEFISRWRASNGERNPSWTSPPESSPHSSTRYLPTGALSPVPLPAVRPPSPLPVVASHCPGLICYAEKTTPQLLPYLSSLKSAQQIIGTVLKCILPQREEVADSLPPDPRDIYHVSIQPCFDKKLEGSRQDFYHEDADVAEVDLVLSTTELWRLLEDSFSESAPAQTETRSGPEQRNKSESGVEDGDGRLEPQQMAGFLQGFPPDAPRGRDRLEGLFRVVSDTGLKLVNAVDSNAGSGGFAEYLFKFAAEKLFGQDLWAAPLTYTAGRNVDIAETVLTDPVDGKTLLTFSRMYGFRNIQSLVLKMKRKRLAAVDYVELMACPSGCANGGGQIKTKVTEHPSETVQRVEKTLSFLHSSMVVGRVEDSMLVQFLYGSNGGALNKDAATTGQVKTDNEASSFSFRPIELFQTTFHAIPKLESVAPLAAKW